VGASRRTFQDTSGSIASRIVAHEGTRLRLTTAFMIAVRHGAREQSTRGRYLTDDDRRAANGQPAMRGDRDGKTPLDFASRNYQRAFSVGVNAPAASFPETAKLLKGLIAEAAVARP
jgi:hypothetical protein